MKKMVVCLVLLFIVYFGIQKILLNSSKGHEINYRINKDGKQFEVEEVLKTKQDNDKDNYYITVNYNNVEFTYQVFEKFDKKSKIIKDLEYFEDNNYKCFLPIFEDNSLHFDILCYDGNVYKYYYSIKGSNKRLDDFVSSLRLYNSSNWFNNLDVKAKKETLTIYNNLVSDHYIGISNYKGINLINKKNNIINITLFQKDVYQRKISGYVNNYYITADYTKINDFDTFEIVDIKTKDTFKINSPFKISYNSYVLGSVENSLYIYDRTNRLEYEVNVKEKTVNIVGQKNKFIKYYTNGKWSNLDIKKMSNNQFFGGDYYNDYANNNYEYIVKKGNKVGYYYLFKHKNNYYEVYRINIQNKSNLTYLFDTTDYNSLIFLDDYIYYLNGTYLNYYNNREGIKTVLRNTEFEFNKTIKVGVYN